MTKNVLITGATSGIGQATTRRLSAEGYRVFATYRNPAHRAALAALNDVHPIQLDLTDEADIRRAIAEVSKLVGDEGLYAVVNNAGNTYAVPFEYSESDRFRDTVDVNLMAPYLLSKESIPLFLAYNVSHEDKARVINVASWAGYMASPFISAYNATKYGLVGLTESMYYDLGILDVHTVLVNPGVTKTPLLGKTTRDASSSIDRLPQAGKQRYEPYITHYESLGEGMGDSRLLLTPERMAEKLVKVVGTHEPRFRYNLSGDSKFVVGFLTRFVPFRVRALITRRMYQLSVAPSSTELLITSS